MLLIKPKYCIKKKKKVVQIQTVEPVEYDGASKPKRQRIDRLINGKGIIYE